MSQSPHPSSDASNDPSHDPSQRLCGFCHESIHGPYYQVSGQTACARCARNLQGFILYNRFAWGHWLSGLGFGLAAALAGAIGWALVTKWTNSEWGLLAVLIAVAVSKAVVFGAGNRRGRSIQVLTIGLSLLGIFIGKGLIAAWVLWPELVAHQVVQDTLSQRLLLFVLSPVMGFGLYDLLWYAIAVWEGWRQGRMPRLNIQGPFADGERVITASAINSPEMFSVPSQAAPASARAPAPTDERRNHGGTDTMAKAFIKTAGSMVVSVAVYWMFLGWQFALGLVLLIFVHEMGHVVALRYYRLNASPPIFIPFLGALINLRQAPPNAKIEAIVGIGGPVAGTIGAIACLVWYAMTHNTLALELSYFGFFLNLFNMIPMPPLDGGRVTAAISPWFWILGLVALGGMVFEDIRQGQDVSILLLILIISLPRVVMTLSSRRQRSGPYYAISRRASWTIGVAYILLLGLLGGLMWHTSGLIHPFAGLG